MPKLQAVGALISPVAGSLARISFSQIRNCSAASASSAQPVIGAKHPFQVDLEAGKRYSWCSCGHSQKQPFCDGSHKKYAPKLSPLRFQLEEAKEAWLCGCKYTKNPPYCDGTHKEEFVQKANLHSQPLL
ncbi:CDGSH iron-sulfur domain-containing protein 3, mitochondrial [Varanus komodoensis]|uniref:Iron-binding zinc finger CDGSH type domain-containing protein n=1 Tax=Varanus komodoensis TaxID=61221 RepID=A0A8D2KQS6_VARKO|nr:CDGSH iron-sulfur domain-containing protein 3, mitochondrial [Varanus komodoensis]KAF7239626.1 CDGSH iron-sulfur domain-containing protein 3, mitochondrial [Varanus komodoensis]